MKIITREEVEAHEKETRRGALEGVAAALAITLPGSYLLHKRWSYYRALPIQLKALGVVLVAAPICAIQAEKRGLEFEKTQWNDIGKATMDAQDLKEYNRIQALTTGQRILEWTIRNQYKIILGSWALSMGVAGSIIMKDRYQTAPQKLVQARVWAQGVTIGMIIVAAILSQSQSAAAIETHPDHSWALVIEEQERQKQLRAARSHA